MKTKSIALTFLLSTILACSAAAYYPLKVTDARGRSIVIRSKPMRVVSLAPSNTEILCAVGLRDRLVGVTRYCNYPSWVKDKPKIGDMTVSVEAVVALKPDLVVAHAQINESAIPKLEKLGITVFAVDPKTLSQVARDIRVIGRIVARPRTAERVAARLESQVEAIRSKPSSRRALVVIQSQPFWVAGPRTFVDEMLKLAGARNIAYDARPGFTTFSKELAVSRDPEVIIVGLKSDVDYFRRDPAWRRTGAVKNGRVYVINHDLLVRAGPRLADGLRLLSQKLRF